MIDGNTLSGKEHLEACCWIARVAGFQPQQHRVVQATSLLEYKYKLLRLKTSTIHRGWVGRIHPWLCWRHDLIRIGCSVLGGPMPSKHFLRDLSLQWVECCKKVSTGKIKRQPETHVGGSQASCLQAKQQACISIAFRKTDHIPPTASGIPIAFRKRNKQNN
jgi:hypothetical protein